MYKYVTLAVAAVVNLGGCSSWGEMSDGPNWYNVVPNTLDKLPVIYRPTIQQGNVVSQDMINKLEPGMSRRQVSYLLGTPQLVDVFHQNRWDYVYTIGEGSNPSDIKRVSLHFENDRLTRIEGDQRPEPMAPPTEEKKEIVVTVPDWEGEHKTLWGRTKDLVGLGEDDYRTTVTTVETESAASPEEESKENKSDDEPGFWDKTMNAIGLGDDESSQETNDSTESQAE